MQEPSESGGCGTGLDHRSHAHRAGSSATITSRKKPGYQYEKVSFRQRFKRNERVVKISGGRMTQANEKTNF